MLDVVILTDAKTKGKITARALVGLKTLTTCGNWKKITPLGLIDYRTTLTHYQGMLVELDNHAYFVRKETMTALSREIRWKVTQTIKVE
jgi:hypothetical protein